eukprot:3421531-Lingulodinium_polyedra.AAC.1
MAPRGRLGFFGPDASATILQLGKLDKEIVGIKEATEDEALYKEFIVLAEQLIATIGIFKIIQSHGVGSVAFAL